jgi:hypothetical protein
MRLTARPVLGILIAAGLIVVGFVYLLKGCLAKYDERFAKPPVLLFEKEGKSVVFTITEFQKTVSYSRKGGMVRKSVNTTYYIQSNDAATTKMVAEKKVKNQKEIKNHPVEIMGAAGDNAWLFMNEPMAFDAFTLELKADKTTLEKKNPSLSGKLPDERRYYFFNPADKNIYFTAKDGTKWKLYTQTLLATQEEYDEEQSPLEQQIALIEKAEKKNREEQDSLYQQKNLRPSKQYATGQITREEYGRIQKIYFEERTLLSKGLDSLRVIKRRLESQARSGQDLERAIKNLQRGNPGYYNLKINQDTVNGHWFGLYAKNEFDKLYNRMQHHSENDETARRRLYKSTVIRNANGDWQIEKENATFTEGNASFLHGGFLLDKKTALPVHLAGPDAFLIIHKQEVGQKAAILVSRVRQDGNILWTYNTQLTEWLDWQVNSKQLIITGTNNEELSGSEANVLFSINLITGKATGYDYFKRKLISQ